MCALFETDRRMLKGLSLAVTMGTILVFRVSLPPWPNEFVNSEKPMAPDDQLTTKEQAVLRDKVYNGGRSTYTPRDGPWAFQRSLSVPNEIAELHKRKRLPTLRILLVIVKGGRPNDAVLAASYIVALEMNPVTALMYAHYPLNNVDEAKVNNEHTGREELIEIANKIITTAEKQIQDKK